MYGPQSPRAHQEGTRLLLEALVGRLPTEVEALLSVPLPDQVPPEENGFKYDVYLTEGSQSAWGVAVNDRWSDPEAELSRLRAVMGEGWDWALAQEFGRRVGGRQVLALGFGGAHTRLKIYRQEDPWGAGVTDGPGLQRLAAWLGLPVPEGVGNPGHIGVVTLELMPGGERRLKAYLGASKPETFATEVPELLPAMQSCSTEDAWFYLTLRLDRLGVRKALNKIYNPLQVRSLEQRRQSWEDVGRLFAQAGADLDRLMALQRRHPELLLLPTATAVEDAGRSVDVYVAAWKMDASSRLAPGIAPSASVDALLGRWCAAHPGWRPGPIEMEGQGVLLQVIGAQGAIRLRIQPAGAGPAMRRGELLQVVALATAGQPVLADDLAAQILEEEARLSLPAPESGPKVKRVELFVVDGCNLSCAFCCESTRIQRRQILPREELRRRLEVAAASGVKLVQFMGGEASLHPDFPESLRYARSLGMSTYTITNLLRWEDRAFAEAVAPHLDEVMVSVHAGSQATGASITGREGWWRRFRRAHRNAVETLRARVRASTVLTRQSLDELESITELVLALRPHAWILGSPVPVAAARADAVELGLDLRAWKERRPQWEALSARAAAAGCRLVWFCVPPCVLGPRLAADSHDGVVDNQDLSNGAPSDSAATFFWSQADFLEERRPVTLARRRGAACASCRLQDRCGGYFAEYLDRFGEAELEPIP